MSPPPPTLTSFSAVLPLSPCCFSARQRRTRSRARRTHFVRRPKAPSSADTLFPELRQRSILQTGANVGGGSSEYLPSPGSRKAAQGFCMSKPHPFQTGSNLHLRRGGRFLKQPPCGAARLRGKNKASCWRLPRRSFQQTILAS